MLRISKYAKNKAVAPKEEEEEEVVYNLLFVLTNAHIFIKILTLILLMWRIW
jgi:hypothetical protein